MNNLKSRQGRKTFGRALRLALLVSAGGVLHFPDAASAQVAGKVNPPPVRRPIDENGVDVIRKGFVAPVAGVSIGGDGNHGLDYGLSTDGVTTTLGTIEDVAGKTVVTIEGHSDTFTLSGGAYTSTEGEGATLVLSAGTYIYTSRDGIEARFASNTGYAYAFLEGELGRLGSVKYPDGTMREYAYRVATYCSLEYDPEAPQTCFGQLYYVARLQSIRSSNGYQMRFNYAFNDTTTNKVSSANYGDWGHVTDIVAINQAVQYCDAVAATCSISGSWPTLTFNAAGTTVTDSLSRTTTFGGSGVTYPDGSSIAATITGGAVQSVNNRGIVYNYAYSDAGSVRTTTVTDPNGGQKVYTSDTTTFLISSVKDELNRTTSYQYDGNGRVTRITAPEGNYTQYTYDARGNVTEARHVAKPGSGLADIVTSATFDASCTNAKTCNKPLTTTDAKGNVTDYTYDTTHGGVLTVTAPAATGGGTRPQSRYSYTSKLAYYKVSGASIVAGPYAEYKLTGVSACQTTASCAGALDEVKTSIDYGPQTAGTANNLLPVSVSSGAGNGSLTATTALAYDNIGNRTTVDGPLSGTADTTRTIYDAGRQMVGVIGPDPDGGGSRPNPAQRYTYNNAGQVTLAEVGTTAGQTDPAWAGFTTAQQTAATYDANGRPVKQELKSGGTTYALAQTKYDALGRVSCTAQRMDPSVWASQTDACTPQTTGSYGPDRIAKSNYDAASEVTSVQTAYGTSDQATEVTSTFNSNGTLATVKDGENNLTTYEYDGHDRLTKTRYPSTTQGAGTSSTTDYEQPTYDANGNVTSLRRRDGQSIGFTYDNLNRVTLKDLPNGVSGEADINYSWDNLGRPVALTSVVGNIGFSYDALGRTTGETGVYGAKTMQYDLAGHMTRFTWPDSVYATYDYDVTGNVTAVRENGATSGAGVLATYSYDNLGRRTGVTRGNGTTSSYSYDAVSRPTSLSHDLAGSSNDITIGSLAYNPVSQLTSLSRSNDGYAWTGHYNEDRSATLNGLNQQTGIANTTTSTSISFTHDGRGNISAIGASGYGYTAENLMASGGTASMVYDPLARLKQLDQGSAHSRFDYLGHALVTELDSSNTTIVRRYVPGPGTDEPIVWYEGSGTTDRRWLHADERGSVIAVSDGTGAALAINRYDPYGKPASGNLGRFGYTGQAWLPELGMWYYKARIYNPENNVARFMQSDPIGYGGGMNMYAYVGGDPVNLIDPSGKTVSVGNLTCAHEVTWDDNGPYCSGGGGGLWDLDRLLGSGSGSRGEGGGGGGGRGGTDPSAGEEEIEDIVVTCDSVCQENERIKERIFSCVGGSYFGTGGVCRTFRGEYYLYAGVSYPPGGDFSLGYAYNSAEDALPGFSISGNGFPGASFSVSKQGLLPNAWTYGTPGGSATYTISITDISSTLSGIGQHASNVFGTFSNGFYNMAGRPYDAPSKGP